MRANPGGTIGPQEVIGRDELVRDLWNTLDTQSVVLTSERRIGKTTLLRKMKQEMPVHDPANLCVLRDLEGLRSPQEFIDTLYSDIEARLSKTERLQTQFWGLLGKLGGAQIGDLHVPEIRQHWKKLLFALMEDLCNHKSAPARTFFFWDELPLFIYNVRKTQEEAAAMEVLDVLRAVRQEYSSIRMVFTGSVGLHQVLGNLRKEGYANAPTNDMRTVEVPPLNPTEGGRLAALLLDGEGLQSGTTRDECAANISELAGHVPFYIHGLVARLSNDRVAVSNEAIADSMASLLADPNDPAHFRYYRERIRTYYSKDEADIALAVLDYLCSGVDPAPFSDILNRVRHRIERANEEIVRDVVHLLGRDHYVNRDTQGRWAFRYEIVRRWWRMERG